MIPKYAADGMDERTIDTVKSLYDAFKVEAVYVSAHRLVVIPDRMAV